MQQTAFPQVNSGMQDQELVVVMTTVATLTDANALAEKMIRDRLAACVQIEGEIVSHYRWDGKQERSTEHRLSMKTTRQKLGAIRSAFQDAHPYELPQWVVLTAADQQHPYVDWVRESVVEEQG
ncbi:MAG: divalent-cation tolerance protein CutA [Planctomycetota bacterium]